MIIQPSTAPNKPSCQTLPIPLETRWDLFSAGITQNIPQRHSLASVSKDESALHRFQKISSLFFLFFTNAQRLNESITLQQELFPARAVTRQNGSNGTAAAVCCSWLGLGGENRVPETFKRTLFSPGNNDYSHYIQELHFENKQSKTKQKSVWLLGLGFGVLVRVRMNLPTSREDPRGAEERGGELTSAKAVLNRAATRDLRSPGT